MRPPKPTSNYMSLKQYAEELGICYRTAWNRYKNHKLPGAWKNEIDGHVYVPTDIMTDKKANEVTLYVTATSNDDAALLAMETQIRDMTKYCQWRGWKINDIVREVCSDVVSGFRPKFNELLRSKRVRKIVINKRADVCFYGFDYIKTLLISQNRSIHVMDDSNEVSDYNALMREAVNTIYAMCRVVSGSNGISKVHVKQLINKLIL